MFYINGCGYFIHQKREPTLPRKTTLYELEVCTTGGASIRLNGKDIAREPSMVYLIRPGTVRQSVGPFQCHYVHFACSDNDFTREFLSKIPEEFFLPDNSGIISKLREIVTYFTTPEDMTPARKRITNALLESLIMEIYLSRPDWGEREPVTYSSEISRACVFISEHFCENISVADAARAANLSPGFFHAEFKRATGLTPHAYISEKRLKYACHQLLYTRKSVTQVSVESGFTKENYLNYFFKRHLSMTPGEYRKRGAGDEGNFTD